MCQCACSLFQESFLKWGVTCISLLAPSGALVFFMIYNIPSAGHFFQFFSNSLDSKVLKRPNMCYIFEKHEIQGYQIWHSPVSNVIYTNTQKCKYTNAKWLKDPTCAIFFKSMGFKDIKYDIPVYQMWNTQIHLHIKFTHHIYTLHLHIIFTLLVSSIFM